MPAERKLVATILDAQPNVKRTAKEVLQEVLARYEKVKF